MDEKSIFIRLLKFWASKGIEGFSYPEFKEWAGSQPDLQTQEARQRARRLIEECCECVERGSNREHFILKSEYYFRLVEFQELAESRLASKSANRNAIGAMVISVLAIAISIFASYKQLTTEVTINPDQVAQIVKAVRQLPAAPRTSDTNQPPSP